MDRQSMVVAGEPLRVTRNGRRYFSAAHREAVVAKCLMPGASLAAVALANGFNANLVRKWVRQRPACDAVTQTAKLLPVTIAAEPATALPELRGRGQGRGASGAAVSGSIRVRVKAIELEVQGAVDGDQLSLVLEALLRTR